MSGYLPCGTSPAVVRRKPCPTPRSPPANSSTTVKVVVPGAGPEAAGNDKGGGQRYAYTAADRELLRVNIQIAVPRSLSSSPVRHQWTESARCGSQSQERRQRRRSQADRVAADSAGCHHSRRMGLDQRHQQHHQQNQKQSSSDPRQQQQLQFSGEHRHTGRFSPDPAAARRHAWPRDGVIAAAVQVSSFRLAPPPARPSSPRLSRPTSPCLSRQTPPCPQQRTPPIPAQRTSPCLLQRTSPCPSKQRSPTSPRQTPPRSPRPTGAGQQQAEKLSAACRRFNAAPAPAVNMMILEGLLPNSPSAVASFLRGRDDLHKKAIGEYLAEGGEFPQAVLAAFVTLFDFSELTPLAALRSFLHTFLLHGEHQQICRVLECFAGEYHRQNPASGLELNACETLVFALVILNTGLHNPRVPRKQTPDEFVEMVTSSDPRMPPREQLLQLYHQLRAEELPSPTDDSGAELWHALSQPEHRGWLTKQGGRIKTWKTRWFVLKHSCLHYFEDPKDREAKGVLVLENVTLRTVPEQSRYNCFELVPSRGEPAPGAAGTSYLKSWKQSHRPLASTDNMQLGQHTEFRMSAPNQTEMAEWMRAIQRSIVLWPLRTALDQAGPPQLIQTPTMARQQPSPHK